MHVHFFSVVRICLCTCLCILVVYGCISHCTVLRWKNSRRPATQIRLKWILLGSLAVLIKKNEESVNVQQGKTVQHLSAVHTAVEFKP